jgi:uncharacterized protein (DUF111 family)
MKTAYLDCFSGCSGDMMLGALLDAGLLDATLMERQIKIFAEERVLRKAALDPLCNQFLHVKNQSGYSSLWGRA